MQVAAWAAIVLVLLSSTAVHGRAQTPTDDVEQVIATFLVPFSSGNVAGFIDYFADDATVFMPPIREGVAPARVTGKAAIKTEFEALFGTVARSGAPLIRPQDLNVQRFGDVAVVTFHLGSEASRSRRTFVLRKTEPGWKIVHLHASTFRLP
jgi:ketosteroid isomerase-like protein